MAVGEQVSYDVTGSTESTELQPGAGVVQGRRISFKISDGTIGTVFVPDAMLSNISGVRAMVQAKVQQIVQLHALTGQL